MVIEMRRVRDFIYKLLIPRTPYIRYKSKLLNQDMILLQPDYWVEIFTHTGIYEKEVTQYILTHGPYDAAIDVGANCGYYTVLLSRLSQKVYAFEPDPRTFRALLENTKHFDNVQLSRVAAGDAFVNNKPFSQTPSHGSSGMHNLVDDSNVISVSVRRLDDVIPTGTKVDLMKIDVEGHEAAVLKGSRRIRDENPDMKIICETKLSTIYDVCKVLEEYERQQLNEGNIVFVRNQYFGD
ncbi:MAG: hypothetical protein C4K48_09280 [Candidatus Thorarchaeota archaeon]|nr:MAG: hypothetical protein C4K48_09280 [Candidatus Thorarchaeota archaeon]